MCNENSKTVVESLTDYLAKINAIYDAIENREPKIENPRALFFRGHARASFDLLPTALRKEGGRTERVHLLNYRDNMPRHSRDYHYIRQRPEILADMQHHGMHTRLLDWSFSPLTALFFALGDDSKKEDSEVIVLNPWEYHSKLFIGLPAKPSGQEMHVLARSLLSTHSVKAIKKILSEEFYGDCLDEDDLLLPFPFVAKYGNDRLIHQSGAFTIHGAERNPYKTFTPLDKFGDVLKIPSLITKITISKDHKEKISAELSRLFINPYSIYPDLDGMSQQLKEYGSLYSIRRIPQLKDE